MPETELVVSDGLAPARCPRALRLAATGAGLVEDDTPAAARRKFAAAGEALREARSRQCARNGKRARGTRGRGGRRCAAPGTLDPGGVASRRGARRPRWRPPRYAPRGEYEAAHRAALTAFREVAAAARCITAQARSDYDLVYKVMDLAPSFGRTRGKVRGAGGSTLEWRAARTRASLAEAEEAAGIACGAWRASEQALRCLWSQYRRMRRRVQDAQDVLAKLKLMRRGDAASGGGTAGTEEERGREKVVEWVAEGVATLQQGEDLACVWHELDKFRWGVWGSARRCRASLRELETLRAALHEAEWGTWPADLPGGSAWTAAVAAAMGIVAPLSGGDWGSQGGIAGGNGTGAGAGVRPPDSYSDGCCSDDAAEAEPVAAEGRQAAGGGHTECAWSGRVGVETRRLVPGSEDPHEVAWRCMRAAWQQMAVENRRMGLQEDGAEDAALCVGCTSMRKRLWLARKHRRWRRLRRSCYGKRGVATEP
jgi:hypothetical protein